MKRRYGLVILICAMSVLFVAPANAEITVSMPALGWHEFVRGVDLAIENLLSLYQMVTVRLRTDEKIGELLIDSGVEFPNGFANAVPEIVGRDMIDMIFPHWPKGIIGNVEYMATPARFLWVVPLKKEGVVLVDSREMVGQVREALEQNEITSLNYIVVIDIPLPENFPEKIATNLAYRHPGLSYVPEAGETGKLTLSIFPNLPDTAAMVQDLLEGLSGGEEEEVMDDVGSAGLSGQNTGP